VRGFAGDARPIYADAMFNLALLLQRQNRGSCRLLAPLANECQSGMSYTGAPITKILLDADQFDRVCLPP
jgi:hypothetical protein